MITVTWKEYDSDGDEMQGAFKVQTHSRDFTNPDQAKDFAVSVAQAATSKEIEMVPNSLEVTEDFI